ncbi:hypothetical protein PAAG_11300 [Paracoccidioides lutzii Pb01]|uniref:Uncharacterized protein n=1 Tax=Paracoccidioides lutzii (strain ATCC MYA-826 / Pb01) TaxID=502779 RepID=A0A0A2V714_PARBA|nr:hypothetical protein PAAG_11300 [Paracoccidioides lutzii Pb01]KGQ01910.1 hypothetical protein PAAG_11300 [Paracoccidioides lutzii Pb01]
MLPQTFVKGTMDGPYTTGQHSADFMRGTSSRKGDPFIKRWHDLFIHLWESRSNHSGICSDPLIAFGLDMDFSESQRHGYKYEFKVEPLTHPESPEYKTAYQLVWHVLTSGSMQKVSHAKPLSLIPALGYLWDDNRGSDCKPGTFADLLRYGSVHFEQTRRTASIVQIEKPKDTMKKGVLEP